MVVSSFIAKLRRLSIPRELGFLVVSGSASEALSDSRRKTRHPRPFFILETGLSLKANFTHGQCARCCVFWLRWIEPTYNLWTPPQDPWAVLLQLYIVLPWLVLLLSDLIEYVWGLGYDVVSKVIVGCRNGVTQRCLGASVVGSTEFLVGKAKKKGGVMWLRLWQQPFHLGPVYL